MIIQSTRISRKSGPQFLTHHLLDKLDENERIEVLAGDRQALHDAHALAAAKGCRYSIRHLSISPERDMSPSQFSQFFRSIDNEFEIGPDRPSLIVRHIKKGRSHFHLAFAEVDPVSLRVLDCRNDFARLEKLARIYELDHGETVQLTHSERRSQRIEAFSDVARKKAERISPTFDRTKLKTAFASGRDVFFSEVERQGLKLANGEKGPILINGAGEFVAAANRAVGTSRATFSKFMGGFDYDGNNFRIRADADNSRAEHKEPLAAPIFVEAARGARPHRPADERLGAYSGCPASAGRGTEGCRRTIGSAVSPIVSGHQQEQLFLRGLASVDFDNLLQRAREMAEWVQSIFEPQVVRLKRQIQELQNAGKQIVSADTLKPIPPTYNLERRLTP